MLSAFRESQRFKTKGKAKKSLADRDARGRERNGSDGNTELS